MPPDDDGQDQHRQGDDGARDRKALCRVSSIVAQRKTCTEVAGWWRLRSVPTGARSESRGRRVTARAVPLEAHFGRIALPGPF
jgi:hypothetical protein